jgi:hypothetical protein
MFNLSQNQIIGVGILTIIIIVIIFYFYNKKNTDSDKKSSEHDEDNNLDNLINKNEKLLKSILDKQMNNLQVSQ